MDYYVGLDLSVTHTGLLALNSKNKRHIEAVIKTSVIKGVSKQKSDSLRKQYILRQLNTFLNPLLDTPNSRVFFTLEDYSMGSGGRGSPGRVFSIGEVGGVVRQVLFDLNPQADPPFNLVAPSQLKKFATNNGRATKDEIKLEVSNRWGFVTKDDNLADAYVAAKFCQGINSNKAFERYEPFQKELIIKIQTKEGIPLFY